MNTCKRGVAFVLVLVMLLSISATIFAANYPAKNNSYRHKLCTELSTQAENYYTGDYSWESLLGLEGDTTGSSLKAKDSEMFKALQKLMDSTMTDSISYKSLEYYWLYTDTQPGYSSTTAFYSDCNTSSYNREHVWPKSRASFQELNGGCDLHHLRPTFNNVNSTRGNYTMANVREMTTDYKTYTYGGEPVLYYNSGMDIVEVNDNIKGDVARIMLYVYVRWGEPNLFENVSSQHLLPSDPDDEKNNGLKVMYDLDTVLEWCEIDPVDQWEMTRNDRSQDVQGNRNVFIDYPELAWLLFEQEIPSDMETPSGYAKEGAQPAFEVTARSSNEAWGTVSVNKYTVTASPKEGYMAAGATVSPAGAAQITRNGNNFVLSKLTSNVTVTVEFAEREKSNVTYSVPAGVSVSGTTSGYVGDVIKLPNVTGTPTANAYPYSFEGWVEAPVTTAVEDLDTLKLYKAGAEYTISAPNVTLYALYSYEVEGEGDPNTFTLVTEDRDNWEGAYVMTGTGSSQEYVHLATGEGVGSSSAAVPMKNTGITQEGDCLKTVSQDYVILIEKLDDGTYSMKLQGASKDTYLAYTGSNNSLTTSGAQDSSAKWNIRCSGGEMEIRNATNTGRVLRFNLSAELFRCYTGGQKPVNLYAASGAVQEYYLTQLSDEIVCTHVNTELQNAKEATCTEDGYTGDLVCTDCGETIKPGETIAAPGHTTELQNAREATCTEDGYTGDLVCTACGETVEEGQVIPANCPSKAFTDLNTSSWYHEYTDFVISRGLMTGTGVAFNPNGNLTRAQLVTILYRMEGEPAVEQENPFADVPEGKYYTEAVLWASAKGITTGVTDTKFDPNSNVTRAQMVTFLYRYAKFLEVDVSGGQDFDLDAFTDGHTVSSYAREPMKWACSEGIVSGMGNNKLNPTGTATRAQFAKMITVLYGILEG